MLRRSLACLVVLAACGPAAPQTQPKAPAPAEPPAATRPAAAAEPPVDGETARWVAKLGDPRESERAVQKLEELGDPRAIPALGRAWSEQGRPVRLLQVIISLAKPLTKEEAAAAFLPAYEKSGRPAHWDAALPFLRRALEEVDEVNPRAVDSAAKAADAIGEARLSAAAPALIAIAHRPTSKKLVSSQVSAIRALGKLDQDKPTGVAALVKLIDREPPPHPETVRKEDRAPAREQYELFLTITGSAINALAELRSPLGVRALVIAQYRTPALFTQIRRALVASGPDAKADLRKILSDRDPEVESLFKQDRYGKHCAAQQSGSACAPVSAKKFYPAIVLGDFYDPAATPELLGMLNEAPHPAYYLPGDGNGDGDADDRAGPTQRVAALEALGKIGSADAAKPIYDLWKTVKSPRRGQPPEALFQTKLLAMSKYPFLARDVTGVGELAGLATDNGSDRDPEYHDQLRMAAAEAFARLSRDPGDLKILQELARKYLEASAAKRKAADGKPRQDKEAADQVYEGEKRKVDDLKIELLQLIKDESKSAEEIRKGTKKLKDAELVLKDRRLKHREVVQKFKELDGLANAYKSFARTFQYHIARIQTGIRCKDDLGCYADTLGMKPDDARRHVASYIPDLDAWTEDEALHLLEGTIERAMLELGKRGQAASRYTDRLLDHARSDNRTIRQSILLALPKIASIPCQTCEAKLDAVLRAGEGKTTLGDLQVETTMMRLYFASRTR